MYICYQNPTAMKRLIPLFLSALPALVCCGGPSGPVDAVDPTIGGVSVLLETTRQTVHLPNQMLRFVPLRADMLDDWIDDFALQMADHRRHWVFGLMPFCTADTTAAWSAPGIVIREETHPHYYRACLDGVTLECAPAERSGIVRITFEGEGFRCVRLRTKMGLLTVTGEGLVITHFGAQDVLIRGRVDGLRVDGDT